MSRAEAVDFSLLTDAQQLFDCDSPPLSPILASPQGSPRHNEAEDNTAVSTPPMAASSPTQPPSPEIKTMNDLVSQTTSAELTNLIEAELFAHAAQQITSGSDALMSDDNLQQLHDEQVERALTDTLPERSVLKRRALEKEVQFCNEAMKERVKVRSVT